MIPPMVYSSHSGENMRKEFRTHHEANAKLQTCNGDQQLERSSCLLFCIFYLLGTQPYKETCGDKHKTRHRGCRDDVPMYREQLDRPGVLALALQPGIEKRGGLHGQVAKIIIWCEKGASIAPNNINT